MPRYPSLRLVTLILLISLIGGFKQHSHMAFKSPISPSIIHLLTHRSKRFTPAAYSCGVFLMPRPSSPPNLLKAPSPPQPQPDKLLSIRLPDAIHVELRVLAAHRRCTMQHIVLEMIRKAVEP